MTSKAKCGESDRRTPAIDLQGDGGEKMVLAAAARFFQRQQVEDAVDLAETEGLENVLDYNL